MDLSPLWISCAVSLASTALTTVIAVPVAKLITSLKKLRRFLDILLSLPLVLPPTVVGFFLLILFGRNTLLGRILDALKLNVIFTIRGAVIAAAVVSFPIVYRTARAAFEQIDPDLIDVARLLGYSGINLFFSVYVPLSFRALAVAVILSFARAIGEFGATIMIAGNIPGRTRTMSVAVYTAMQSGDRRLAYIWTAVILALSFVVLFLMDYLVSRQYRSSEHD
ncbi:MAG: molybdate ABC transporter permease subunit [Treponema sp.]|nr:molybdate ABC transporter permease subunit [Treponema sp.]